MTNREETLKSLKRKRGSLKAKLTHFKNFIDETQTKYIIPETPILGDDLFNLDSRIEEAYKIIEDFDGVQLQLEDLVEESGLNTLYTEREEFTTLFHSVLARSKTLRSQLSNDEKVNSASSVSDILGNPILNSSAFRLPPIEVPKFSGSHEDWLEFRETFSSLVHTNNTLLDIQKFHYLKSSLTGNASQVIMSIEFSDQNYSVAWGLLCERYNNERLLVHNHVKALFNLEVKGHDSSRTLRFVNDSISKHLKALKQLNQPTEHWDTLIIYIVTSKLDNTTAREWEEYRSDKDIPTLDDLKKFLKSKADLLETIESKRDTCANSSKYANRQPRTKAFLNTENTENNNAINFSSSNGSNNNANCAFCKRNHYIRNCSEFLKLSPNDRSSHAKRLKLCINCLRPGHFNTVCRLSNCRKCNGRHNTLLHLNNESGRVKREDNTENNNSVENTNVSLATHNAVLENVLLATALVQVVDKFNKSQTVRALLDSASQSSFMSSNLCDRLDLKTDNIKMSVLGLNNNSSQISKKCEISIESLHGAHSYKLSCLVIDEITGVQPSAVIDINKLYIPKSIILADPGFHKPGPIDLLIGANLFWKLMVIGQIHLAPDQPVLQNTTFGWIISGNVPANSSLNNTTRCNLSLNIDVQTQLARFWELEECNVKSPLSDEERLCEQHFIETTKRDLSTGRFIVSIPFKGNLGELGDSEEQARKRFLALERKLMYNPTLRAKYTDFMEEYRLMGHMVKVNNSENNVIQYYLPHHGVLREESVTTKLRVVFDASARTSSGISLNDLQMVGPTIQNTLLLILLRFRVHAYVITADIEKMYRQVLIAPEQRPLQQIFWRSDPNKELDTYQLNTVTYGTASAPFLAIRCIVELAQQFKHTCPDISRIIENDVYVDDLITGTDSIEEAARIGLTTAKILSTGGFKLRKWHSNNIELLEKIQGKGEPENIVQFGEDQNTKTLGLGWSCKSDCFTFKITPLITTGRVTKRIILSSIGQIFDPLGLLAPCIINAKIILQKLWLERINWDEAVPPNLHTEWFKFISEIPNLNLLNIPRHVISRNPQMVQIHGFSDASEHAYGACIYVRSITHDRNAHVRLFCAKSKVAPLKIITIPKLELCAAIVMSRLLKIVEEALRIPFDNVTLWTDSTIVLGWLKTEPHRLKTFTANRVAEIQTSTTSCEWRHVPTKDNPADLLSRGASPRDLQTCNIWWHGPQWLSESENEWPEKIATTNNLPELKSTARSLIINLSEPIIDINRFSSLNKMIRTVAFVFRFISILKCRKPNTASLQIHELQNAKKYLLKISQQEMFPNEIRDLLNNHEISSKSKIFNLNPFIDKDGLLRVGGRLKNSEYSYDKKHPVIVSSKHRLCKLIFSNEHLRLLHAGPQLLLNSLRESIWPLSGRNLAKATVRECVICFKFNAKTINPIMGDLPRNRFDSDYPFKICGVDYGGPFRIKDRKGRGCKTSKCYMALFVCFAVKAVHIELVSDLSTESFLLALKRFISRRGRPHKIYSDNGSNFIGANNELNMLGNFLQQNEHNISTSCSRDNIEWHFIPAHSPHFGGLWEAGIKSSKHHLRRIIGNSILTFEELSTVRSQIEAVLNSRPLSPLSSDPNDINPLTPAHFLIGKTLTSIPAPDVTQLPVGRLSRYQLLEQMRQNFWRRWSKEYVSELQQRVKWKKTQGELQEGSMVLVKEDSLTPLKWKLGRVLQLHPGRDGITRVATIQTSSGVIRRAFPKICPLPIDTWWLLKGIPFKAGGMLGISGQVGNMAAESSHCAA